MIYLAMTFQHGRCPDGLLDTRWKLEIRSAKHETDFCDPDCEHLDALPRRRSGHSAIRISDSGAGRRPESVRSNTPSRGSRTGSAHEAPAV